MIIINYKKYLFSYYIKKSYEKFKGLGKYVVFMNVKLFNLSIYILHLLSLSILQLVYVTDQYLICPF